MAASVVSLPIHSQKRRNTCSETEPDSEIPGVIPLDVDCLGRPLPKVAFTVTLRRMLSFTELRCRFDRWRTPVF